MVNTKNVIFMKTSNPSPLRYPGSKRKLTFYLQKILEYNKLNPNVLVEPFVGGASISLHFLINKKIETIIISDKDRLISSFWHTLFSSPNHMINFVNKVKVDLDNFYKYKEIAKNIDNNNKVKLAEACLFLNRTSFSGILKNNTGPIGGKKQNSRYKINCRFNRKSLIEKIRTIASFKGRVIVLPYEWEETIEYVEDWMKRKKNQVKILFYFDPPFYYKADNLYRCYFTEVEHKKLFNTLLSFKHNWILSYDRAPEIIKMYSEYANMHIEIPYSVSANSKRIEKELVITPLSLPKFD